MKALNVYSCIIIFMQPIEPQHPLKVAGVPDVNYVGREKTRIPDRRNYSMMELLFYLKEKGMRPTRSREWTAVLLWAEKNNPELAANMLSGDAEVQEDIIAWPDGEGKYSERIQPAPEKGKYPLLVQRYILEGTPDDYTIRDGTRTELENFLKSSGALEKPIDELGLSSGAFVYSNNNPEVEKGLRAVFRGDWLWDPDKRHFGTNVYCWPSTRRSGLASRKVF